MLELCLGIDPIGSEKREFFSHLKRHRDILDIVLTWPQKPKVLKPNLSFFLRFGSYGITLLEEFVTAYRDHFTLIMDLKCNEIDSSLERTLGFVFEHLGCPQLTVNPFLGRPSLELAAKQAHMHFPKQGRIYILCLTSQQDSSGALSYLQGQPEKIIEEGKRIAQSCEMDDLVGFVVGAAQLSLLPTPLFSNYKPFLLSPGVGAQGASIAELQRSVQAVQCPIVVPMSRFLFEGGCLSQDISLRRIQNALQEIMSCNT